MFPVAPDLLRANISHFRHYPASAVALRDLIKIVDKRNRAVVAWCFIGDDDNVEKIADILSQKGQPHAAMELRELARTDRRNAARTR